MRSLPAGRATNRHAPEHGGRQFKRQTDQLDKAECHQVCRGEPPSRRQPPGKPIAVSRVHIPFDKRPVRPRFRTQLFAHVQPDFRAMQGVRTPCRRLRHIKRNGSDDFLPEIGKIMPFAQTEHAGRHLIRKPRHRITPSRRGNQILALGKSRCQEPPVHTGQPITVVKSGLRKAERIDFTVYILRVGSKVSRSDAVAGAQSGGSVQSAPTVRRYKLLRCAVPPVGNGMAGKHTHRAPAGAGKHCTHNVFPRMQVWHHVRSLHEKQSAPLRIASVAGRRDQQRLPVYVQCADVLPRGLGRTGCHADRRVYCGGKLFLRQEKALTHKAAHTRIAVIRQAIRRARPYSVRCPPRCVIKHRKRLHFGSGLVSAPVAYPHLPAVQPCLGRRAFSGWQGHACASCTGHPTGDVQGHRILIRNAAENG